MVTPLPKVSALVVGLGLLLAAATPSEGAPGWQRRLFDVEQGRRVSCGVLKTTVRIDEKVCPANRRRPAIVVRRACCLNGLGRTNCKPFPNCPRRSLE